MTHASVPDGQRALLGIDDTLIRLSVGVESAEDLISDLDNALNAAVKSTEVVNTFLLQVSDSKEEGGSYWDW